MTKGTIVLIPFPFTDISGFKVRPCIVISEQKHGEDCVVLCISSKKQGHNIYDIAIQASQMNGLKIDSIIKIDKIATLQKKIFLGELGKLELKYIKLIDKKLKQLFDI